jgi:hypothetical protein
MYWRSGTLPVDEFDNSTRFVCDGFICSTMYELAVSLRAFGYSLSTTLALKKAGADDVLYERTLREIMFEFEEAQRAKLND